MTCGSSTNASAGRSPNAVASLLAARTSDPASPAPDAAKRPNADIREPAFRDSRTSRSSRSSWLRLRLPICGLALKERARPLQGAMAIVAQLVRASACGTEGRGFKSRRSPHFVRELDHSIIMTTPWGSPISTRMRNSTSSPTKSAASRRSSPFTRPTSARPPAAPASGTMPTTKTRWSMRSGCRAA